MIFKARHNGRSDLSGIPRHEQLPESVKRRLELIENFTQTPMVMFSTSPKREDTFGAESWV